MLDQSKENIERHIKTHTERSDDDRAAVSVLETFLRSGGRINSSFSTDDKWPKTMALLNLFQILKYHGDQGKPFMFKSKERAIIVKKLALSNTL